VQTASQAVSGSFLFEAIRDQLANTLDVILALRPICESAPPHLQYKLDQALALTEDAARELAGCVPVAELPLEFSQMLVDN
jgi:hypothetical protein